VPLHLEAVERLREWMAVTGIADEHAGPLFRSVRSPRGNGRDGFLHAHMTVRAVEYLVTRYVRRLGLPSGVSVHSLRVTALTTARHRGADIIDLQDFAGYAWLRITRVMPSPPLCGVSRPDGHEPVRSHSCSPHNFVGRQVRCGAMTVP
jgi:integrase/recombinase XerD